MAATLQAARPSGNRPAAKWSRPAHSFSVATGPGLAARKRAGWPSTSSRVGIQPLTRSRPHHPGEIPVDGGSTATDTGPRYRSAQLARASSSRGTRRSEPGQGETQGFRSHPRLVELRTRPLDRLGYHRQGRARGRGRASEHGGPHPGKQAPPSPRLITAGRRSSAAWPAPRPAARTPFSMFAIEVAYDRRTKPGASNAEPGTTATLAASISHSHSGRRSRSSCPRASSCR